eukprot:scaffold14727_cov41-Attheya_sp.AAC.1
MQNNTSISHHKLILQSSCLVPARVLDVVTRVVRKQQSTQLRSPLIAVPPLEDSVIHPQLPSTQQSPSVSFSRTTPQPNTGAMPTRVNGTMPTSHHRDTYVEPPLRNRESHNNYGGIVDVN